MAPDAVTGRFTIEMTPGDAVVPGTGRFDFTKIWTGGVAGTSSGTMLSAGDPVTGNAGYVAMEVFEGRIGGRTGTIAFQQCGTMQPGDTDLRYLVAPGSGTGDLAGVVGHLDLTVDRGEHEVTLHLT